MAELGRISGPMLKANLERLGVDLVFKNQQSDNLLYLDVNNKIVGINTDSYTKELEVNNDISTTNLIVDTKISADLFEINNLNTITSLVGPITFNPATGIIRLSSLSTSQLNLNDNVLQNYTDNGDLNLNAAENNKVVFTTNEVSILKGLRVTNNITLDGNIKFGNTDTDSVIFASDIDSDVVPDQNEIYSLGTQTKRWDELYTQFVNGQKLETNALKLPNVTDIALRQGKIWYVADNGLDTNVGNHQNGPYATIKKALQSAQFGDTVYIYPGEYQEEFPLTVPQGVLVKGTGIRSVTVEPTEATRQNDAFLLNGETTVVDLTVRNFFYNETSNTGYGFRFAPGYTATDRSPYIQNVSVITKEDFGNTNPPQITVGPSSTLFSFTSNSVTVSKEFYSQELVDSLVGQTAVIDRYPNPPLFYTVVSIDTEPISPTLWRITFDQPFNPAGQLKPISFYPSSNTTYLVTNDIWDTTGNSIGEKWVAWFKTNLPADFTTIVGPGWNINVAGTIYVVDYIIEDPVNTNQWRIYVTTSLVGGVGIPIFSPPSTTTIIPAGRGALVDGADTAPGSITASMLFHSVTFITPNSVGLYMTNGVRVEWLNSFTYFSSIGLYATNGTLGRIGPDSLTPIYGAEVRSIGSANVYGTYGSIADGANTLMYLIQHNFAYIGTGLNSLNDPTIVISENETVELNNGKIYYQSLDQSGKFRVGDVFLADQESGTMSIDGVGFSLSGITSFNFADSDSRTYAGGDFIDANNIRFVENTIQSTSGSVNFQSASNEINLTLNADLAKNLSIGNDFNIDGTLQIGDQIIDSVTFLARLDEDLVPSTDNTFDIGSQTENLYWDQSYINSVDLDELLISDNIITVFDNDLELRANGTGRIVFNSNVLIENDLEIDGSTSLRNTNINGDLLHTGSKLETGTLALLGNIDNLDGNLTVGTNVSLDGFSIIDNRIFTTASNADFSLAAAGSGKIKISLDPVRLDKNLTVNGLTNTSSISNTGSIFSTEYDDYSLIIKENFISNKDEVTNIVLSANGTGSVILESVSFNQNTISATSGQNLNFKPGATSNLVITGTSAVKLPSGTTANRPTGVFGDLRFSTTDNRFGGWSTARRTFGGVFSSNRLTSLTSNTALNSLNFVSNSVASAEIVSQGLRANGLQVDNVLFNNNQISSLNNSNITLSPNGTGIVDIGDFDISQNTILSQNANGMILSVTGQGHIKFAGTAGLVIPFGGDSERPQNPEIGDVRFNTDIGAAEVFNGIEYQSFGGQAEQATAADVQAFDEFYSIILG